MNVFPCFVNTVVLVICIDIIRPSGKRVVSCFCCVISMNHLCWVQGKKIVITNYQCPLVDSCYIWKLYVCVIIFITIYFAKWKHVDKIMQNVGEWSDCEGWFQNEFVVGCPGFV